GSPPVPGPISGPAGACKGQLNVTYSVPNIPGSTFIWYLPAGCTGSSTTNSITVSFSSLYAGGFICVADSNGCGLSAQTCLPVPVLTYRPAFPGPISGPPNMTMCGPTTATFSIPAVPNATSYTWTVSGVGLSLVSGQGTNSI